MSRRWLALLFSAAVATAAASSTASAAVPNPAVEGPVEGGLRDRPLNHSLYDLRGKGYDYTEREYLFSGTATHLPTGLKAPYRSRMLVRLPRDARDFSGEVAVEWLNVTGQQDLETAWPVEGKYLMRHGIGYVAVSAQLAGVCCGPGSLKVWDPERYLALFHPGDLFSWDIFSQSIEALRDPAHNAATPTSPERVDPMRGMRVKHLIATGASQSAIFLTTFVNDGYNRGDVDLYVIARGGGPFRDFSTPIFQLNEEDNEIPQADNPRFVGWEEAGTAHAPAVWWNYIAAQNRRDLYGPGSPDPIGTVCQVNRGTTDYSSRALSYWADQYLRAGRMPPSAPRMERDARGNLVRDANGLAKGGLRHPFVEVPVAFNSSEGCPLYGTYRPWDATKIRSLYRSHCDYVTRVKRWAGYEVGRGWLLPEDRVDAIDRAGTFGGPWPGESLTACLAAASGTGCLTDRGRARGRRLGAAALGRRRDGQRRALRGARLGSRRGIDRYCVAGGGSLRIAYPTRRLSRALRRSLRRRVAGRAVLILSSSPRFSVRGIRAGARVTVLRRRLRGERRLRARSSTWYVARGRAVSAVYKTRSGRVLAVGIADARLARGRRAARRFLSAWPL